jgi:hypothetical protein
MSKYYVNKFLFTVDRDPELSQALHRGSEVLRRHLGTVDRSESSTMSERIDRATAFTDAEREGAGQS